MVSTYWASDIHLDICEPTKKVDTSKRFQFEKMRQIIGDNKLIVSGDISNSSQVVSDLIEMARQMPDSDIYFVLGNHDFYGNYINNVRREITDLVQDKNFRNLHYIGSPISPIYKWPIGDQLWTVIGIDGWADGIAGNFMAGPRVVRDYKLIGDLVGKDDMELQGMLSKLGREEAEKLKDKINHPVIQSDETKNLLIVTHVPPFSEAYTYQGKKPQSMFPPHFVCVQTGEVLRKFAYEHPEKNIHVICGHTHDECNVSIASNLHIHVAHADYGKPSYTNLTQVLNS